MSKVEVDQITQQSGTTLTVGGGACKTAVVDATTVTLGRCGGTVSLASGATQSGFGRTGTVDWQTGSIKTTTFTAVNGEGYFADTSAGAFNMNLPAGSAGSIVSVVDYTNTFQTYSLTIVPNGSDKIGGTAANATLTTQGQSVTFVYVDGIEGWKNVQDSTSNAIGETFLTATVSGSCNTLTTAPCCSGFKVAKFVSPGTFCVSAIATDASNNEVSYMVIAGGGGGGGASPDWTASGGGGAGGYREKRAANDSYNTSPVQGGCAMTLSASPYSITVGGGGAGVGGFGVGNDGADSVFNGITSTGGGGGTAYAAGPANPGGSGGGGGGFSHPNNPYAAGSGNTPTTNPSQGNPGGSGAGSQDTNVSAGGGGGIGTTGGGAVSGAGGAGGNGVSTSIDGTPTLRGGGGGGGGSSTGTAGPGGGGAGSNCSGSPKTGNPGTDTTGGGGGGMKSTGSPGGGSNTGGNGGDGVVIIRYKFQ